MTKEIVEKVIVNKFGYQMDKLMPMPKISMILLRHDANYRNFIYDINGKYTDVGRIQFLFNSNKEILEIVEGHTNEIGEFISRQTDSTGNPLTDIFIPFSLITGISSSSYQMHQGRTNTKAFPKLKKKLK